MLRGSRILVVEDETMVALELQMILIDQQAIVVGPYSNLQETLLNLNQSIHCALLDIDLHGTPVFAVTERLVESAVPFAFLSGGDLHSIPEPYRYAPLIRKPFAEADVLATVAALIAMDANSRLGRFQQHGRARSG